MRTMDVIYEVDGQMGIDTELDRVIEKQAKPGVRWASGSGGGKRDLAFDFEDLAEAEAAQVRLQDTLGPAIEVVIRQ